MAIIASYRFTCFAVLSYCSPITDAQNWQSKAELAAQIEARGKSSYGSYIRQFS